MKGEMRNVAVRNAQIKAPQTGRDTNLRRTHREIKFTKKVFDRYPPSHKGGTEFHLRMEELRLYHGRYVKTSGKETDEGRDWSSSTTAAEVVAGDGRDACSAQPP